MDINIIIIISGEDHQTNIIMKQKKRHHYYVSLPDGVRYCIKQFTLSVCGVRLATNSTNNAIADATTTTASYLNFPASIIDKNDNTEHLGRITSIK